MIINSVLKNVALNAFATQTLENETWEGMVNWATTELANGKSLAMLRAEARHVEKEMKAAYDVTAMPTSWRSAKSVVFKAIEQGVSLTEAGKVKGKTATEIATKAARLAKTTGMSIDSVKSYCNKAKVLAAAWHALSEAEQDKVPHNLRWNNV